jgi:(S)-ureidoglycine-glyoxylate aminotransferase
MNRATQLLWSAMRDPLARLDVPRRLLMGSGPSNPEVRVLQAMATQSLAADDPALLPLFADVSQLCGAIFQAEATACSLAVSGASRAGLEAALASLIQPGDRVLVGVYGHFGELLCTLARLHGAEVERVEAEWGQPVDLDTLTARIRERPPRLVAIVHADTSTGVLQPLEPIGAACRETGALLLADAVLSLGGCEVNAAAWHVDAAVAGLQKCLGGPPGLGLVALSGAGQTRLNPRPDSVYLDLSLSKLSWATPRAVAEVSTTMVLAAREALRIVLDEGLPVRWQRHQQASQTLRAGIDAMGLQRFGKREYQVPMITLVNVPEGIDEADVRQQLLVEHGIEIMAAFGPLRGRVWRIGTMGTNACLPSVLAVLGGLEAVLASRGYRLQRGAGVDAAQRAAPI